MRDSPFARCGRAIAAHADHLLIAALIAAKLAGVEVRVERRESDAARTHSRAGAAVGMAMPHGHHAPGADRLMHHTGLGVHRAAEESSCARAPRLFPRPESRREQQRRARGMIYGATPDGRPRQAG